MHTAKLLRDQIRLEIARGQLEIRKHFPNSRTSGLPQESIANTWTVEDLLNWHLSENLANARPTTKQSYGILIRQFIEHIGNVKIGALRKSTVLEFVSKFHISLKQKNNALSVLRKALSCAVDRDFVPVNVLANLKGYKIPVDIPEPFTIGEIERICDELDDCESCYYEFAFWTGLSTSEQMALTWADIDLPGRIAHINKARVHNRLEQTKNARRIRPIALFPPAVKAIEKLQKMVVRSDLYVFVNPRTLKPWTYRALTRVWKNALRVQRIAYRRPYDTRHTFASLMVTAGIPMQWIKQQLGHSNYQMLENRYATYMRNLSPDDARKIRGWFSEWARQGHLPPGTEHFFN